MPLRIVDPRAVLLVRVLRAELTGDDFLEAVPLANLGARGRGQEAAREDDAHLDELVGRNAHRL